MVEPVDPFERGVLDGLEAAPGSAPVDHLGFVEAVDCLGQSVDAPMLVKALLYWPGRVLATAEVMIDFPRDITFQASPDFAG